MKINWKVRLKNPVFWFNLAAAIFLPMLACLGMNWEDMTSWQAIGDVLLKAVQNPVIVVSVLFPLELTQRPHYQRFIRQQAGSHLYRT